VHQAALISSQNQAGAALPRGAACAPACVCVRLNVAHAIKDMRQQGWGARAWMQARVKGQGSRFKDKGMNEGMDAGKGQGSWIMDHGSRTEDE